MAHPDYDREWREKNRDARLAYERERYATRPDAKAKAVAKAAMRKRRMSPASSTTMFYASVLRGDSCSYCGRAAGEVDHIEPIAAGGANDWTNLTGACRSCNAKKQFTPLLYYLCP